MLFAKAEKRFPHNGLVRECLNNIGTALLCKVTRHCGWIGHADVARKVAEECRALELQVFYKHELFPSRI
jgi:hypothetical protein